LSLHSPGFNVRNCAGVAASLKLENFVVGCGLRLEVPGEGLALVLEELPAQLALLLQLHRNLELELL